MAIDDVVSSYSNQVASAASLAIQPAGGDEWLVTQFIVEDGEHYLTAVSDGGKNEMGQLAGATSGRTDDVSLWGLREVRFFVTNSEYINLLGGGGSTLNMGFSAIKTKD
tara:strand:- start:761 stop:1087 length:327 start_codon:yes stop_codon:yes gene_type:complete